GTFANIGSFTGNDSGATTNTTITGPNAGAIFTVTGANAGTVGAVGFTQAGNLTGGTGTDSFVFQNPGTLSGNVDGGAGTNSVDLSAKVGAVAINLQTPTFTGISGTFANIGSFKGNDSGATTNTTITGPNAGAIFTVTGANAGTVGTVGFTQAGNLTGGTGTDSFVFQNPGTLSGNVDGGAGTNSVDLSAKVGAVAINLQTPTFTGISGTFANIGSFKGNDSGATTNTTITGPNAGAIFTVTGANAGTVGAVGFTQAGNLTGGTGTDSFVFQNPGTLSGNVDGGAGTNSVDLSAKVGAVAINLQTPTFTGISGTFANIGSFKGNDSGATTNTTITGPNAGAIFTVTGANAGTVGTVGFTQAGNLTGGT